MRILGLLVIALAMSGCTTLQIRRFPMENLKLESLINVPLTSEHWRIAYTGGGDVHFDSKTHDLVMRPRVPGTPSETYASLVLLKKNLQLENYAVRIEVSTLTQLRAEKPNDWEVFWFFGNYRPTPEGKKEANYFIMKPRAGVELGTVFDEVGQNFLKTAADPVLHLGEKVELILIKRGGSFRAYRNQVLVLDYQDGQAANFLYSHAGTFGLYSEDALVRVHAFSYLPL